MGEPMHLVDESGKENKKNARRERVHFIDMVRGICILLVVFFHLCFDLHFLFGVRVPWMEGWAFYRFRDGFVAVLILISGISCKFSRSNLKRGARALAIALLITLGSLVFARENVIVFGILHFFGTAMLLYGGSEKLLNKVDWRVGILVGILGYILTYRLFTLWDFSDVFRSGWLQPLRYVLLILGFQTGVDSADYYPLLPHIFLFYAGINLGSCIVRYGAPKWMYKNAIPPLSAIGRHTLLIYLAHQPILIGVLFLILKFANGV